MKIRDEFKKNNLKPVCIYAERHSSHFKNKLSPQLPNYLEAIFDGKAELKEWHPHLHAIVSD